ncbi:hypothetical protein FOCC_FOCC014347 [Frankliniella occidentalis]|nr:hypothetical protein FOCC_FOCC014347 [Frankliniella occidentalis]
MQYTHTASACLPKMGRADRHWAGRGSQILHNLETNGITSNSPVGPFDIGHKDAFQIMTIQEDIDFYKSMQTGRQGFMLGIDAKYRA